MIITITEDGYICDSSEKPIAGRKYYLEPADEYTPPMRRLLEALIQIAHDSGLFSVDTMDIHTFRSWWMVTRYPPLQRFRYVSMNMQIVYCDDQNDIPDDVMLDWYRGNKKRIERVRRSSTELNKNEMSILIDNTIDSMQGAGIDTPKFRDIIQTISEVR